MTSRQAEHLEVTVDLCSSLVHNLPLRRLLASRLRVRTQAVERRLRVEAQNLAVFVDPERERRHVRTNEIPERKHSTNYGSCRACAQIH